MKPEIRIVSNKDAEDMLVFARAVGGETDFLSYDSEGLGYTVDEEEEILKTFEKGKNQVMFLALGDGEIVGSLGFGAGKRPRIAHVGEFGMAVRKKLWGSGVGSALIDSFFCWCRENEITKINLRVRTDNSRAIALYKRKGFQIEGKIRNDIKVGNIYYDHYIMGIFLPEVNAQPVGGADAVR